MSYSSHILWIRTDAMGGRGDIERDSERERRKVRGNGFKEEDNRLIINSNFRLHFHIRYDILKYLRKSSTGD